MEIKFKLNGKEIKAEAEADTILLDFLREQGCYSVKRGCETANCGLCTVLMNKKSVLSCSVLAVQADGQEIVTLEGMQKEAEEFGDFFANEGAEQCGFCNPAYYECICHVGRNRRANRRRNFGISGRKSLSLFRICGTDQKYFEIFEI